MIHIFASCKTNNEYTDPLVAHPADKSQPQTIVCWQTVKLFTSSLLNTLKTNKPITSCLCSNMLLTLLGSQDASKSWLFKCG